MRGDEMKVKIGDLEPAGIVEISEPHDCVHEVKLEDGSSWLLFPSHDHASELALSLILEYVQNAPEKLHGRIGLLLDYSWANGYTNEALRAPSFKEFTKSIKQYPQYWWAQVDGAEHKYELVAEESDEIEHDLAGSGICYRIAVEEGQT
jgi:hypothetical protein